MVKNLRVTLIIILISSFFLVTACGTKKNNTDEEQNQAEGEVVDRIHSSGDMGDYESEGRFDHLDFKGIDPPPRDSFILGKFPLDDGSGEIIAFAWEDMETRLLWADFIYFNYKDDSVERITEAELVDNRRKDRRESVVWLDDERALVNGFLLFSVEDGEVSSIKPEGAEEIWDYHVNSSKSALAVLGRAGDRAGLWMIDLDTLHERELYRYTIQKSWFENEMYRVYWAPDNTIYFDVDFHGRPAIYRLDAIKGEERLYLFNATLHSVDQETGEVRYSSISEEMEARTVITIKPDEEAEPRMIMEAAEGYMKKTGRDVGQNINKVVLTIERMIGDNRALVAFGPWASEYTGILILEREESQWRVIYEKYTNFIYKDGAIGKLAELGGYEFEEKPGKHTAGMPYESPDKVVILTGPYESYWKNEYTLERRNGEWRILEKREITGTPVLRSEKNAPQNILRSFLEAVDNEEFKEARTYLYGRKDSVSHSELKDFSDVLEIYDVGEARLQPGGSEVKAQAWLVYNDTLKYGWWKCVKVNGEWKVIWNEKERIFSDND